MPLSKPDLFSEELTVDLTRLELIPELRAKLDATPGLAVWSAEDFALHAGPLTAPAAEPSSTVAGAPPRAGTFADVSNALLATPLVKDLLSRVADEARAKLAALRREWDASTTATKVGVVAMGALVGGSALAAVLAADASRRAAFELLKGADLPVPGVDGLSVKLLDAGVAATMPTALPGMSVTLHAAKLDGARPDYGVLVSFDLAKIIARR